MHNNPPDFRIKDIMQWYHRPEAIPQWIKDIIHNNPPDFRKNSWWGCQVGNTNIMKVSEYQNNQLTGNIRTIENPIMNNTKEELGDLYPSVRKSFWENHQHQHQGTTQTFNKK